MRNIKLLLIFTLLTVLNSCNNNDTEENLVLTEEEVAIDKNISKTPSIRVKGVKDNFIAGLIDSNTPKNSKPHINEGEFIANKNKSAAQWHQVFTEEFTGSNYSNPGSSFWTEQYTGWGNNGSGTRGLNGRDTNIKWWGWRPEQTFIYADNLILQTEKQGNDILICGSANTAGKLEFLYGWFEAKIGIQDPQYGSHTAFWLQSPNQVSGAGGGNNTASDGAEIDIFESVYTNTRIGSVVHYDGYGANAERSTQYWFAEGQDAATYHTYALHWWSTGMDIYYDGSLKVSYRGAQVSNTYEYLWLSNGAAFDRNHPSSGANGFTTRASGSKYWTWVDYVRVWQYF